jgi:hypothetical protein
MNEDQHTKWMQVPEPLSDDELVAMAVEDEFLLFCSEDEFIEIARAIEKAHGITGVDDE